MATLTASADLVKFVNWFKVVTKTKLVVRANKRAAGGLATALVDIDAYTTSRDGCLRHIKYQAWEPLGGNCAPPIKIVGTMYKHGVEGGRLYDEFEHWPKCPADMAHKAVVECVDHLPSQNFNFTPHYAMAFASLMERQNCLRDEEEKDTCRWILQRWNVGGITNSVSWIS